MTIFYTNRLPDIDLEAIRRGLCPWCLCKTYDGTLTHESDGDICPNCGDEFLYMPEKKIGLTPPLE